MNTLFRKTRIAAGLLTLILSATLCVASANAETIYTVTAESGLRLRDAPSLSYSYIIKTMRRGTEVKKLDSENGWWLVYTKDGKVGYCAPEYLSEKDAEIQDKTGKLYYINSVNRVNVYRSPSTSSPRVGKISGGTVVRVLKGNSTWALISVYNNGNVGCIPASYLKAY